MSLKIQQGQLSEALSVSQAAAYVAIAAKDHAENSPIGKQMAKLNAKLVDLTLEALEIDKAEQPLPEPVVTDTVN